MLAGNDKIYHILVCAFITIATFFVLVAILECYNIKIRNDQVTTNINHDVDVEIALPTTDEVLDNDEDMHMMQKQKICIRLPERKYLIIGIISGVVAMLTEFQKRSLTNTISYGLVRHLGVIYLLILLEYYWVIYYY